MLYIKKLNALCEEIEYFMRRNLIRYFIIVFERECDARIKKMIDFQLSLICYYVNYILFYYIKNCFKKALREFIFHIAFHFIIIFQ